MGKIEANEVWRPKLVDLSLVEGAYFLQEGFSRPNWTTIRETVARTISPENVADAWTEVALQWIMQLGEELGGSYQVGQSEEFILLSELDSESGVKVLTFAEATLKRIEDSLKDAAWKGKGKHVILLFSEDDDYYQYLSFYLREGINPPMGGCLIQRGYVHIVVWDQHNATVRRILAHELAHNCVVHLRLPLWLNEGIAQLFGRAAAVYPHVILDHELRDRHLAFWNPDNIQKFWSGVSFKEPGESVTLSYSLAEIMTKLLLESKEDFGAFVRAAKWHDAGQTAALECMGVNLGEVVGTFLGEGNWRPYRKAMVDCWKAYKEEGAQSKSDERANS